MQEIVIKENESGQRMDKFLRKYFPEAQGSFLYKMLRKKNITINGKKVDGSEKLELGDKITVFFSEETIDKFRGSAKNTTESYGETTDWNMNILYQDEHVLLVDKPAGVLTQKAQACDVTLNEWLIGYLLKQGTLTAESLRTFKPSVCNRLDRNTSGIVICSKTLAGSQKMSALLKDRSLHKYYRLLVRGQLEQEALLEGWLIKDSRTNKVVIQKEKSEQEESSLIQTKYLPLQIFEDRTYLEVELITGKTHQIRAHLASMGHPLLGDYKYGDRSFNDRYKKNFGVKSQLLHAYRLEFPTMEEPFEALDKRVVLCDLPEKFQSLLGPLST